MDRPIMDTTPQSVQEYVAYLEEKVRGLSEQVETQEQSIQTAASIRDNWEAAYREQEGTVRRLQSEQEKTVIQARSLALSLERTEKNLRSAHMKEGVLAALLEQERANQRAQRNSTGPQGQEPGGES